jgi:hypothetical protein
MDFKAIVGELLGGKKTEMLFQRENWDCSEEALKTANGGSKTECLFYI